MKQNYLLIGTVLKPQGIRGESKIKSYAADIESFRGWKQLFLRSGEDYVPVSLEVTRIRDGFVYALLNHAPDANAAEAFRGKDLYLPRKEVPKADPEDNGTLIADLIGCRAVDETGAEIGVLTEVLQHGPVDTWVFKTKTGTMMAPALLAVFPEVDEDAGQIRVCAEKLREVAVFED